MNKRGLVEGGSLSLRTATASEAQQETSYDSKGS